MIDKNHPRGWMKGLGEVSRTSQAFGVRDEVMKCVREHRCVPKTFDMTDFESLISSCCMGFELVYPETRRIVSEQGYLDKLMNVPVENETMEAQLRILRREMQSIFEKKDVTEGITDGG